MFMCAHESIESTRHLKMLKGEKRHFPTSSGGKWFAHPDVSESRTLSRDTCTTTGFMLNQAKTSPQDLNVERYPIWKTQQKSREYPHSHHDNKHACQDNITVFSNGVGRRKCPEDLRQHKSHFSLCDDGAGGTKETQDNFSTYRADFMTMEVINVPNRTRRFPRNHKLRSEEAAKAQAAEQFMWFGRHNLHSPVSLEMLAAAKKSDLKCLSGNRKEKFSGT